MQALVVDSLCLAPFRVLLKIGPNGPPKKNIVNGLDIDNERGFFRSAVRDLHAAQLDTSDDDEQQVRVGQPRPGFRRLEHKTYGHVASAPS